MSDLVELRWKDLTPEMQDKLRPYCTEEMTDDDVLLIMQMEPLDEVLINMKERLNQQGLLDTDPDQHDEGVYGK